jgi:class 3 adenylate cyclase
LNDLCIPISFEMERTLERERIERRLTAILAADVAGYSRLTGLDEEGTHLQLREHLSSFVNPKIAEYRGRIVKNTGDGLLAEFSSAVDAVRCAIEFQRGMSERNADVAPERRIDFRIGINIGDIIIDRGDIFGDGVNVAARLEGIADPGGVCVSDDVFRQVQGRIAGDFVDLGEQQLKNIARPVRVFRVRPNGASGEASAVLPEKPSIAVRPCNEMRGDLELRRRGAFPRRAVLAGAGATVALGIGGSAYVLWSPSLTATAKFAEPHRTALVIGNAQYQFVPPLDNPVRDADSVSEALEQRGFRVISVLNADGRQLADSISDFERTLSVLGGVGVFYYAGRAAYIDGEDVLMPVDVKLDSTQTILQGGVNLATLQARIQAKTTRKFVSNGSAIVYSASKGEEADDGPPGTHSPFTTAFLEALAYNQDELGDLFRRIGRTMDREPSDTVKKQTPYFEDTRTVRFYFNRPQSDAAIGALKVLIFDSCRDNPLKLRTAGR